jgi:DNA-binding LacI/PurR family transcriptional regulator
MSRGISVGMVIVDAAPQFLSAPFTTQIVAGLSNRLSERGYPLTLQGLPPGQVERALALCHAGIDGLCILMGGAEGERRGILASIASLGVPVVLIQENLSPSQSDCCKIRQDDHGGGVMLAQHLVEAGARRMVMLVPEQSWSSMTERCRGITDVVKAHGTCALTAVDCGDESVAATRAALGRYLDANGTPDAVVGGNDRMATAALLEMRTRKIDVPSQVMVTGFNGFSPRDVVEPLLTTVASPAYEIGIGAANAMLDRLATGAFAEPDILLPVQFLPGDSTRPIAL